MKWTDQKEFLMKSTSKQADLEMNLLLKVIK
jgi:hypothetical protein